MTTGKPEAAAGLKQGDQRPRAIEQLFQEEHQRYPADRHNRYLNRIPLMFFYEEEINDQQQISRYQEFMIAEKSNKLNQTGSARIHQATYLIEHIKVKLLRLKFEYPVGNNSKNYQGKDEKNNHNDQFYRKQGKTCQAFFDG